jgi:hypothetical protein
MAHTHQPKRHNLTSDQYTDSLNKPEAGFHVTLGIKVFNAALGVSRVGIHPTLKPGGRVPLNFHLVLRVKM